MSSRAGARARNTAVGLLTLPVLATSAVTGIAVWALLSGSTGTVGLIGLIAVHAYSGLVGLPLVLVKIGTGIASWRGHPRVPTGAAVSALLLVLAVLALYTTGTLLHLNATPGGNAGYKTVHLWSALAAAPLVTHHLVRHLRRARAGAGHTVRRAAPAALTSARRRVLALGGAGVLGWALIRLLGRAGGTSADSGPNDFPVTITAGGSARPEAHSWRLHVGGDVHRPSTFTLDDLHRIGLERHRYDLDCVQGWSVSREWGGVPLAEILGRCGPIGEPISAVFHSTTGYRAALLAEQLSDRRSMITLEVDGVPLSPEHGFPARVMAPGVIGEHCVKWTEQVALVCV